MTRAGQPGTIAARRRVFWRHAGGAAAVELALIAPFLLIGAVGVADVGLPIWRRMQVQSAAQAGAHFAATNGFDAAAISQAVAASTNFAAISASPAPTQFCGCPSGTDVAPASCGSNCASGDEAGEYVRVQTMAQATRILGWPSASGGLTLTGRATIRVK